MRHVMLAVACGLFASGTASAQTLAPVLLSGHASDSFDHSDTLEFDVPSSPAASIGAESEHVVVVPMLVGAPVAEGLLHAQRPFSRSPFVINRAGQPLPMDFANPAAWQAPSPLGHAGADLAAIGAMRPISMEMLAISILPAPIVAEAPAPGSSDAAALPTEDPLAPSGDSDVIVVTAAKFQHAPGDPFELINALSFALTEEVDKAVLGPVARAYDGIVPRPTRRGIRNFLNNLREPVVFVNYLLQLKPGKAIETVGRFAINTTLGLGGVIDVAKRCPFNLPWRPNGFGDTLGVYGVKEGPYIFLPLLGPTTIRDMLGGVVDRLASPIALGGPFKSKPYLIGSNVYRILDRRAEQEDELQAARASEDPYATRRDQYFAKRKARVARLKGEIPDDPPAPETGATAPSQLPDESAPVAGKRARCAPFGAPDSGGTQ